MALKSLSGPNCAGRSFFAKRLGDGLQAEAAPFGGPLGEDLEERAIHLATVCDITGRGRQKGVAEVYRTHVEPGSLLRKVRLEVVVLDLDYCLRIRTGDTGSMAIGRWTLSFWRHMMQCDALASAPQ